jgi:hypothetical protein
MDAVDGLGVEEVMRSVDRDVVARELQRAERRLRQADRGRVLRHVVDRN